MFEARIQLTAHLGSEDWATAIHANASSQIDSNDCDENAMRDVVFEAVHAVYEVAANPSYEPTPWLSQTSSGDLR